MSMWGLDRELQYAPLLVCMCDMLQVQPHAHLSVLETMHSEYVC